MSAYTVVLLDENSQEIVSDPATSMASAMKRARYLLSDDFARLVEGNPGEGIGVSKVEVRDRNGQCRWDAFPKGQARRQADPADVPEESHPGVRC